MAKNIMVQGTMSNSGKSFLVAALCRILKEDGYRVAPYKSQNMALNSYITDDGLEIGRAQAMQAEAAGIAPTVYMNPILLKPTSEMGSQVVVNGKVRGNMKAMDYFANKKQLIPDVMAAYHQLDQEYDVIVIEGAGSPAEINLKDNDIVNMGLADLVDAPVLLVGDIDRGGVFASIYGTVALLEPWEQDRIKGLIINKFRGDVDILKPGLEMLEERVHKKVIGVIPMKTIDLDDEDSLAERLDVRQQGEGLRVDVIRLPHAANFTDFNVFERMEDVVFRYVTDPKELKQSDLVILPGTKNTMEDMRWLRTQGFASKLCQLENKGVQIAGICGGYQMLGVSLSDPEEVEGGGEEEGLGFLPIHTVFTQTKRRTQIEGKIQLSSGLFDQCQDIVVHGYEIHMGESKLSNKELAFAILEDGQLDGAINNRGTVWGTYLHGIFDNEWFVAKFLGNVATQVGKEMTFPVLDYKQYKEEQYRLLGQLVREALDMDEIYRIIGLEGPIR